MQACYLDFTTSVQKGIVFTSVKEVINMSGILNRQIFRSAQIGPCCKVYRCLHTSSVRRVEITRDRDHLRRIFDEQRYFNDFNKKATEGSLSSLFSESFPGLFKNDSLKTPQGLVDFSKKSFLQAQELVQTMLDEVKSDDRGKLTYIKKLDQLSDILCRVIDVAEFIRVVHPSKKWVDAAQQTHELMFEYMNQLNTNVDLYSHLKDILEDKSVTERLSEEEKQVGDYLKQDFERSGIHMDPTTRDNFVSITQQISVLGSHFNSEVQSLDKYWCEVPSLEFEAIDSTLLKDEIKSYQSRFSGISNKNCIQIPLAGHIPYSILTSCSSAYVRQKIWIALHNSSKDQLEVLNNFIKYRAILAKMLGYDSFAHYQLEHKMAKSPENVLLFLQNLQQSLLESGTLDELRNLYKEKEDSKPNPTNEDILQSVQPWDRDYLLEKLQARSTIKDLESIKEYFSVGIIVSGLSKLFESLYNISFIPEATQKGETWDRSNVRKLKVYDLGTQQTLGYLYLDFWSPKVLPSHFTIVCSRKLNTDIGSEDKEKVRNLVHLDESEEHQLPVVALVCNFRRSSDVSIGRFAGISNEKPTLLSLDQVDTLFHEMGHAMHSMIGRTKLHNLSGTRCVTDFVELPSVLMEFFSKDPRVICNIARHYETGKPLSEELLKKHQSQRVVLDSCETYMQSKMAFLDQMLHSEEVVKRIAEDYDSFDATGIYHELEANSKVFVDKWSSWHGKFPHLFSYGAVYYSYLLDRAIADKVWNSLFAADPWDSAAGAKYKSSILKWGGTRDPWLCLSNALGIKQLAKGDLNAMRIIGSSSTSP